ncbi:MAG: c-type cytochrome [Acidobacteria bacterium]|nr:c-type cytochrome [Acidobacteriota bacterium]
MQRAVRTGAWVGAALLLAGAGVGGGRASTAAGPAGSARGEAGQAAQDERRQAPYDAQQRPPGDPARIARGQALYGIHCRGCHGIDLRGGDLGGPNLLRSQLVLRDRQGELIWPVLRDGQSTPGVSSMPAQSLSETDAAAVAEFIHSILATSTRQGGPPAGPEIELDIVVGDADEGRAYFEATCASCHAADGDLAGIARRIPDAKTLQNTWVRGRQGGAPRPPVRVTVTEASGALTEGRLERLDDFLVALTTDDGRRRSFRRKGGTPRVEIADPMARHTELLGVYSDTDIHNVTAYLVTLQ